MRKIKKNWKFKQLASDTNSVDLYLYGDVESDSYDWWWDEIIESETSANHFKNELSKYSEVKKINLYVNSYGGSVYEAMSIRNQLKRHNATVVGIVDGFAASAAAFILTGCDIVKMYSNTMQMIHNMWMPACGNSLELRKVADDLDKIMEGNRKAFLEKSNGKLEESKLIELLDGESWLTAEECFQYGLCDEIIEENVDLEVSKQMMQKVNNTFEQQVKYHKALMKMKSEDLKPNKITKNKESEIETEVKKQNNAERLMQIFNKKEGIK